jgi:hypothetical protein
MAPCERTRRAGECGGARGGARAWRGALNDGDDARAPFRGGGRRDVWRARAAPRFSSPLALLLLAALLAAAACSHGAAAARVTLSAAAPAAAPAAAAAPTAVAPAAAAVLRVAAPLVRSPPPPNRLERSLSRGAPVIVPEPATAATTAVPTPKLINAGETTSHVAAFAFCAGIIIAIIGTLIAVSSARKPRATPSWHSGAGMATETALRELGPGGSAAASSGMTVGERMRLLKEAQLSDHQYHTMPPVPAPAPALRGGGGLGRGYE